LTSSFLMCAVFGTGSVTKVSCFAFQVYALQVYTLSTGWQSPIRCLIFIGHVSQKSPIISGSVVERDLQLKASLDVYRLSVNCLSIVYLSLAMCLQVCCMCCSVLQCVAVCCRMLQCDAVWCNEVQCGAVWCSVVQCGAVWCSVWQCVAVCCSVL